MHEHQGGHRAEQGDFVEFRLGDMERRGTVMMVKSRGETLYCIVQDERTRQRYEIPPQRIERVLEPHRRS